ncbi:hypothetical protein OZ410_09095 [Robiginitalea sp. M366]|uniref:hypothetical protein n=1 Tax=Robiginitalea aestuariiviva TaxID=3036903 RepID=UPI00240D6DC9|nr:hypothetical protein [Robiginitalea aestuariiviva]MDG1572470.1 hypothetical protein [Robiginitalea aestuariiviva]
MKRTLLCSLLCLFCLQQAVAQPTPDQYEREIQEWMAREYPGYYLGLTAILDRYDSLLVAHRVIPEASYTAYRALLLEVAEGRTQVPSLGFSIDRNLQALPWKNPLNDIRKASFQILRDYYVPQTSRHACLYERIRRQEPDREPLTRQQVARLMADTFREEDFRLLLVRKAVLRFLDPESPYIIYLYAGKPDTN